MTKNKYPVLLWLVAGCLGVALLAIGVWVWALVGERNSYRSSTAATHHKMRLLLVGDPFAYAIQKASPVLSERFGVDIEIELAGYQQVRELIIQNANDRLSAYDVVSFDVVWLSELLKQGTLAPLDVNIPLPGLDDFLPAALAQSQHNGLTYGLPVQPHPELLWVRQDLLTHINMPVPNTTDELLETAHRLHLPAQGQFGLCWNGQRGQALGQQIAHWYGAFGVPLLTPDGRPALNDPKAHAVARFARALLDVSPPDVLHMAWDQRALRFASGGCAMTYEWAARSPMAEWSPSATVSGNVIYAAAPHAPGVHATTPLGTWSLGLPANLGERHESALRFLLELTSAESLSILALEGNAGMPRLSLLNDPVFQAWYPAFVTVARLSRKEQLSDWMRPAVPQWSGLVDILGEVFHDMLSGFLTIDQALNEAQSRANSLFGLTADKEPS